MEIQYWLAENTSLAFPSPWWSLSRKEELVECVLLADQVGPDVRDAGMEG